MLSQLPSSLARLDLVALVLEEQCSLDEGDMISLRELHLISCGEQASKLAASLQQRNPQLRCHVTDGNELSAAAALAAQSEVDAAAPTGQAAGSPPKAAKVSRRNIELPEGAVASIKVGGTNAKAGAFAHGTVKMDADGKQWKVSCNADFVAWMPL